MVEINVYWFYWVSMTVHPLSSVPQGTPLSYIAGNLGIARVALETMGAPNQAFPKTSERMLQMVAVINNILPDPQQVHDRMLTGSEVIQLKNSANAIALSLEEESRHSYVLSLEDQRCLSAYTLVEKIENCFPQNAWDKIKIDAKGEFEESGKCLAMERFTGTGFHALRGVECVIRQYIELVTGALPRKRDWGHYLEVLRQNNADAGLVGVLDNIRTQERNPLMHPEDWLDVDDAVGIFNISHTAVARLIADLEKKGKL